MRHVQIKFVGFIFARKVHFFLSCGGRGGRMPPLPLAPAGAPMTTAMTTEQKYNRRKSNILRNINDLSWEALILRENSGAAIRAVL